MRRFPLIPLLTLLLALLPAVPIQAETDPAPSLSVSFYKKLGQAHDWLKQKHAENARAILEALAEKTDNSPYENGMTWNLLGYLHYQNGDDAQSAAAYEKALQFDIPPALAQDIRRMLGQTYLRSGQYGQAARHLSLWLQQGGQDDSGDLHVQLARCYYETRDDARVAEHLLYAIRLYESRGQRPQEAWLRLLQASQARLNDQRQQIDTLKRLLNWYPKTEYWLALASALGQANRLDDYLAALSVAQQSDLLRSEPQYLSLANAFFTQGAPLRAARILETGLQRQIISRNARSLRFLAASYTQAREYQKALAPLHEAAAQSDNGETDALLGNAHFQLAQWQEAAAAFENAVAKGGFRQLTSSWLLLGQSYLNLHDFDRAGTAFRQAALDETYSRQAQQWLRYVDYERNRYDQHQRLPSASVPQDSAS